MGSGYQKATFGGTFGNHERDIVCVGGDRDRMTARAQALVEIAIGAQVHEGPTAAALRELALGGGGSSGGGEIGWSPAGLGNAVTYADVLALVAASPVPPQVNLIDPGPFTTPVMYAVTSSIDMKEGAFRSPLPPQDVRILRLSDGVVMKNLGSTVFSSFSFNGGIKIQLTSTGASAPLQWDGPVGSGWFLSLAGSLLENLGTTAAVKVPPAAPDSLMVVILLGNGALGAGAGLAPIVELGAGAFCILSVVDPVNAVVDPKWASGNATNVVIVISDGFDFSQVAAWGASLIGTPILNAPVSLDGGSGPTANRPVPVFGPLVVGTRYFDTSLLPPIPIFWDGVQWNNALGAGPV